MKHMRLIALLVVAMMVQGVYAGKKIDAAKKVGMIGWHAGQVCGGAFGGSMVVDRLLEIWNGKGEKPSLLDTGCISVLSICDITLLNEGIRGLNRELKISVGAKKLWELIIKKKKSSNV